MERARRLILVACVATALTADRLGAAAPTLRPQVLETARQIAGRLVSSFGRTVPAMRLHMARAESARPIAPQAPAPPQFGAPHPCDFPPACYRLPPPCLI